MERILKNERITLSLLFAICLVLGLYRLDYQSLWLDEYTSIQVSRTMESIIGYCRAFPEQHPLYYLIVLATGAHESVFSIRLLSLLFGAATVFPLFNLGKKLFCARVAFLSTLFFSVSPFILYYNQEGRMYTLFMFLSLIQVDFFVNWISKNSKGALTGFIVFSILCMYTHFFALFLIFSEALFLLFRYKEADFIIGIRKTVLVFFTLAVSYLPWAIFMAQNLGQNAQTWKGIKHVVLGAPYTIFRFIYGYAVFPTNFDIKINFSAHIWQISIWGGFLFFSLLPAAIILSKNKVFTGRSGLVPTIAFLPLILMILASLLKNMIGERYLLFSAPFFFIMISAIAVSTWPHRKTMAFAAFVLPLTLSLFGTIKYFTNDDFGKINTRAAARYISANAPGNTLILCHPAYAILGPVDYYLKGSHHIIPYYDWNRAEREKNVWLLEDIFNTIYPGDLAPFGYRKIGEKVWPQENGLRLSIWEKA